MVPVSRSFTSYKKQNGPDGVRIGNHQSKGRVILGLIFMTPGILMALSLLGASPSVQTPPKSSLEWLVLLGLAAAFILFGLLLGFHQDFLEVDFKRREIRRKKGLIGALKTVETFSSAEFQDIQITREENHDSDSHYDVFFHVVLRSPKGRHLSIGAFSDLQDALQASADLSGYLGLDAFDQTTNAGHKISSSMIAPASSSDHSSRLQPQTNTTLSGSNWTEDSQRSPSTFVRLLWTKADGKTTFRIVYPKPYPQAILSILLPMGGGIYFFGERLFQFPSEWFGNLLNPALFTSPELFFGTLFMSFWMLFLFVIPVTLCLKTLLSSPPTAYIIVGTQGLEIRPARPQIRNHHKKNVHVPFQDILSLQLHFKQRKWRFQQIENRLTVRFQNRIVDCAHGLDLVQLNHVADLIRPHIRK